MGQPEKQTRPTRRGPDEEPGEQATRETGAPCADEEGRDPEQLKTPPHEKRRGTGLEDF